MKRWMLTFSMMAPVWRILKPGEIVARLLVRVINWHRSGKVDVVMLNVPVRMRPFPEERKWWQRLLMGEPPLSLWELDRVFRRIGDDARIKGVVLYLRDLHMPLADLQALRDSIVRLRGQGKRVVCFAHVYDMKKYYVASAADEIVLQRGSETGFRPVGFVTQVVFLRDALDAIGIQADVVQITPYKAAFDSLTRSEISPEMREQMDWLLDSEYEIIVEGIADWRNMTPDDVRAMIDRAPLLDAEALDAGYIDAILSEEDLPGHLQADHLVPWGQALKHLPIKWRGTPKKVIKVLPVSGLMFEGESRRPPPADVPFPALSEERMGHLTVVQQVRSLMDDERTAAVVLYIDSGGGYASAAEAMTSALRELAQDRPLVVCMGGVAASGGYHIALPAQWIVAQAGTITGSIGVVDLKVVNSDMLKKLRLNAYEFTRGANASIVSSAAPWTEEQRAQMRREIEHGYAGFVEMVANSRGMPFESVDAVAGGRVWTGKQALDRGLVDQLGGLEEAIAKARELAELPEDVPVEVIAGKLKPLGPQLAEQANPAAALFYVRQNIELLASGGPHFLMPFRID